MSKSISRVLYLAVIYLWRGVASCAQAIIRTIAEQTKVAQSMLLRVGFTREFSYLLPCELLPHISTLTEKNRRLFSVALSLESPPPAVNRHPCSMEPGLSSRIRFGCPRPSDLLTTYYMLFLFFCQAPPKRSRYAPKRRTEEDSKKTKIPPEIFF